MQQHRPGFVIIVLVLIACVGGWQLARGQDPNNVPYDPHPLTPLKQDLSGPGSMTVAGQYLYVLKGNRVYQIRTSAFGEEKPRVVDLP